MASRAQSVVNAVAGLSDNELKNLGLTPTQRAAARRALRRGEEAPVSETRFSAPRLSAADRVQWRDIQDVKKDVGLDALPAYFTPFADFMGVMADTAGVGALSPRDLIKAYTITRSSVNRAAVATWRAQDAGLELPASHTDETVRPEGAFPCWLLSDQGQAYLNDAERGVVNDEAIQNAVAVMKPFGMNNTLGEDMRRAVTSDMASLVGKVSDLIDRAHRGEDVVRQWQDAVDGLYGIGYAKKGFMDAMLGYGQLPTFDARQINVQATPESKKDVLSALGGKRAAEMVDKLSRRLDALDLTMDDKYLPFKQHSVHHAVWDAVGKSVTTHSDVMGSMIRASTPRTAPDATTNPEGNATDETRNTANNDGAAPAAGRAGPVCRLGR